MSILNQYVGVAQEATYGTAVTDATKISAELRPELCRYHLSKAAADGAVRQQCWLRGDGKWIGALQALLSLRCSVKEN